MSLSPQDLVQLLDIVNEENVNINFENLSNQLHQKFPKETHFKVFYECSYSLFVLILNMLNFN